METLSHGQQLAVTTLQPLYTEVQQSSKLCNDQAAQYGKDLEKLHDKAEEHQRLQEQRIAKALRLEGERRALVEGETTSKVTHNRTDIQQFVNKQLPGWIQD
jgi:hypothetical protein